jgi:PhnB protein
MEKIGEQGPLGGVTPHLVVNDAPAAIDFYKQAFAATEYLRMLADDGKRVMHAHLGINGGSVMLHDDFPEYRGGAPLPEVAGVTMHLQVDDTDAWFDRAIAAGASVTMAPEDMFWGDRYAQVKDPFGHSWAFGATIRN